MSNQGYIMMLHTYTLRATCPCQVSACYTLHFLKCKNVAKTSFESLRSLQQGHMKVTLCCRPTTPPNIPPKNQLPTL